MSGAVPSDLDDGPVAEVDLAAIRRNLERLRARLRAGCRVLAPVKADAYGHGAAVVAPALERAGVAWFGVATAAEALELRAAGVNGGVLVFGPLRAGIAELAEAGVSLTVSGFDDLEAIRAARPPAPARVHLKHDSGMGRLGLPAADAAALARALDAAPEVVFEGVWTHFARADEPAPRAPGTGREAGPDAARDPTRRQLERFHELLAALERDELRPPLVHAANSAGVIAHPDAHFDLVRPGIALYGYHSSAAIARLEPALEPALRLTAPVTFVKRVAAGTPLSYGHTWHAPRDTTVATVRCGYADGYPRGLSGRAEARLHGRLVPLAGRVCMDQLLLDAGELPVAPGDRALLFGPEGPDAEELAARIGSISYELLVRLGPRVARRYLNPEPEPGVGPGT